MGPDAFSSTFHLSSCSTVDQAEMEGGHMVVTCTLQDNEKSFQSHALIDCGATGYAFIDEDFARRKQLPLYKLHTPRTLTVIDGRPVESGAITHITKLRLLIKEHQEDIPMFVTKLGHYPMVLGMPWLRRHDVCLRFARNQIIFDSSYCLQHCLAEPALIHAVTPDPPPVNAASISRPLGHTVLEEHEVKRIVPKAYHDYLPMFLEDKARQLPPHRPGVDHEINLEPGFVPPFGALYSMSQTELKAQKEWLDDMLTKGFMRPSSSPAAASMLFVKKKEGSLRPCLDYRGLNKGTIKDRYPLPLINETLNRIAKAKVITKIDIRDAYNLIRIKEGDEWKTALRTRYGLYEFLVMPFGLTNAPATFQRYVNDTLRPYLDVFCTAYLDDVLVYSEDPADHENHVKKILGLLEKAGLHAKPQKCEFSRTTTEYLGVIVTPKGIQMDPKKVQAVQDWPTPKRLKDVRAFIGFGSFYRRFIKNFSGIVRPLTLLTKKEQRFAWGPLQQKAFDTLKTSFTTAPVLGHFDQERAIVVETDASNLVSAGILSQKDDDGHLHPVAFFSKKHSPAECNYEIYDKELLAIIHAFKEWRPLLEGATHPVEVISDHRNLTYFMTNRLLNYRQTRWSEFLSRFNYDITYRPGVTHGKADALTRQEQESEEDTEQREQHRMQTLIKSQGSLGLLADIPPSDGRTRFDILLAQGYQTDPFPTDILGKLERGERTSHLITLSECEARDGRLYYRDRLFIPEYEELHLYLLQQNHDVPSAGHCGQAKTFELLSRGYIWFGMRRDVKRYIRNCHVCQRSRTPRHKPSGVLHPLSVPSQPWVSISMDFVTGLPWSSGFDAIWVVVDRLTKMRHFIPCRTTTSAQDLADMFITDIFRLHGLPDNIVSDRGTQFASDFWQHLCTRLQIQSRLSTAFHPETDGQTERMNATMEQYLRAYVSYQQDDWSKWLPLAEFAMNNQQSETIQVTPFYANYGIHPRRIPESTPLVQNHDIGEEYIQRLHDIQSNVQAEMLFAQAKQQECADRSRTPSPTYTIGDNVWLNARHITTRRPSVKLDHKRLGPFPVVGLVGKYACRLQLPITMKVHNVFHVRLLEPAPNDPMPGQQIPPAPPVEVDGEEEWEVSEVLDSRLFRRRLQYLVRWTGYDDPTWEPVDLVEGLRAVELFHDRYPLKPGPLPEFHSPQGTSAVGQG
jgi:transposase InsO family protein/predicted aspartyl protease